MTKINGSMTTQHIKNRSLRATAELIDENIGKKQDHKVTSSDLAKTKELLKEYDADSAANRAVSGPLTALSPFELNQVRKNLPMLSDFIQGPSVKEKPAFATSVLISAIQDDAVRESAQKLASNFGKGDQELNLTELRQAKKAIKEQTLNGAPLPESLKGINQEHIDEIELFLMTGKGGLVSHGEVRIDGKIFDDAYPLKGDPSSKAVIEGYEEQFKHLGYDRIYIKDSDKQLYVVLNKSGKLRIQPQMRVQMGLEGHYEDSGTVVGVYDINNSFGEATWSFWGDCIQRFASSLRDKLGADINDGLKQVSETTAKDINGKNSGKGIDMKDLLVLGGVTASVGAAAFNIPVAMGILGGSGLAMTGINIVDYLRSRHHLDKSPVYHAMGVTLNREPPVNY